MRPSNKKFVESNAKRARIIGYIAVIVGLFFVSMGFFSWNKAVKETNKYMTAEEEIQKEELWRAEYIEKISTYFLFEEGYMEEFTEGGFDNIEAGTKEDWIKFEKLIDESLNTEIDKRTFFREHQAPKYFGSFQARNLNGTALVIDGLRDIKDGLDKNDSKMYEKGIQTTKSGIEMIEETKPAYESAKKLSLIRIKEERKNLEESKSNK